MKIPCTFSVVENLGFEAILGFDFLRDARAVIDLPNNTLTLYDGLISVPLIRADDHITVYTIETIKIPPKSEAIFNASTHARLRPGNYMVEVSPFARNPPLLIARTVFSARKRVFCCRVLNPTERTIEIPRRAPIARVAPVDILQNDHGLTQDEEDGDLTVAEMRAALEQKQISFKDTEMTGADLDDLIRLLYKYRDRFALKLTDLEASDLLLFKIDTGDALPIRDRGFRHTPEQKKLLRQHAQELLDAGIVEPSDSPWSANILLVSKKNTSEKRVCINYRKLNAVTRLATYPMPTFDSIVDSIASQGKSSWFASLDLKSGYFQLKMAPEDVHKTAFQVEGLGSLAFLRLP
jgi:hypothetical protein